MIYLVYNKSGGWPLNPWCSLSDTSCIGHCLDKSRQIFYPDIGWENTGRETKERDNMTGDAVKDAGVNDAPVCIIMATKMEAEPFIGTFALKRIEERPVPVYAGEGVFLAVCGIGKVNAAIAASFCCTRFRPRLLLNLGAAGATGNIHQRGDILQITKAVEYDRPTIRGAQHRVLLPHVLDGFEGATLATQDIPVVERSHREKVSEVADLVDMEGTAVIRTAQRFDVPCLVFKFVSDVPHDEGHDDIIALIKEHRTSFCAFIRCSVLPLVG